MAIDSAYANNTKYKALFGKSTGDNDSELDAQLLAVSRMLERQVFGGRYFTKDAAVTVRRYYPKNPYTRTLTVEDIASTSGLIVKVDDNRDGTPEVTLAQTTDFELFPLNAPTGPEPEPYTELFLPVRSTRTSWSDLVEVTAIHGWPAIPEAVAQGTCQILALLRVEGPRATQRISEGMDSVIGMAPKARDIVNDLLDAYSIPPWVRP